LGSTGLALHTRWTKVWMTRRATLCRQSAPMTAR
jgi:hypothetical protein